ncbi:MAG: helix-turn-helix transcriptional regulator [Alphaproteobacteria bacterium]|nr:helix-turn-helix transcriptional regulator [Alphaproteobacteria bacterium]
MTPLDWKAMVAEALRRRKADRLTQRRHAALAGVSIPTMIAFERGESSLSLGKAFDILRVVGLVSETPPADAHRAFVESAFARWHELTKDLSANSPARFPHGWYAIDYMLRGELKTFEPHRLIELLGGAAVRHSGWAMFWIPKREAVAPREVDGQVECWLPPQEIDDRRAFNDAAHCDFWRAAPEGRFFLLRGYREDAEETFPAGAVFDCVRPIRLLGEALLHAHAMAKAMQRSDAAPVAVLLRARFSGLAGRRLVAWSDPETDLPAKGAIARSDEAVLQAEMPAAEIPERLAEFVHPMVASLFERFGFAGLSADYVRIHLDRMRQAVI